MSDHNHDNNKKNCGPGGSCDTYGRCGDRALHPRCRRERVQHVPERAHLLQAPSSLLPLISGDGG